MKNYKVLFVLDSCHSFQIWVKISNIFRIPRGYFTGERVKTLQFHGFSDASELAYAGVLYLRVEYETGKVDVRFLSSKSKVASIKKQTIPRLELMSAKLLANWLIR